MSKRVGIIGGVGPSATVDLYRLIVTHTPADTDQEHLRVLIDSHPQIPDRTAAILGKGPSPIPALLESIKLLEDADVDLIACPCNTAHVFLREIQDQINVDFVDMIEATVDYLVANGIKKAGLLSTAGTAKLGIYQQTGEAKNVEILIPSPEGIEKEMEAVYGLEGIKAGVRFEKSDKNKQLLKDVMLELIDAGAEAIIMGCTEIPLCLEEGDCELELVNPTEILAKAIISEAK